MLLVHAECDIRAPARFDDALTVGMRLGRVGGASFDYRIVRGEILVCELRTVQCAIDRETQRSRPLPEAFKQRLHAFAASLRAPAVAPR